MRVIFRLPFWVCDGGMMIELWEYGFSFATSLRYAGCLGGNRQPENRFIRLFGFGHHPAYAAYVVGS